MKRVTKFIFVVSILCLCACSKQEEVKNPNGFGTGDPVSTEVTTESADKFAIKEDVLSTESSAEINSTISNVSLNNIQQAKAYDLEQDLSLQGSEVTKEEVIALLSDDFNDISEEEKEELAIIITEKVNNKVSSPTETLPSELVYKHASTYETDEVIVDEEAPTRNYSEDELKAMHSAAEELYDEQQTAETFHFDD